MKYNKISIIGKSATGKTTLSEKIRELTGLPLFHVDDYIWQGKLDIFPEEEYLAKFSNLIKSDKWIIEGYIDDKMAERLHASDMVVYLDYSFYICFVRYIKRWWNHRNKIEHREDPQERFSVKFFIIVVVSAIFKSQRREINKILRKIEDDKVYRITSPKKLEEFVFLHFMSDSQEVKKHTEISFGVN